MSACAYNKKRVYKKTSPNSVLTLYLGTRDIICRHGKVEPLRGVIYVDPKYVANHKIYGQLTLTFRLVATFLLLLLFLGNNIFFSVIFCHLILWDASTVEFLCLKLIFFSRVTQRTIHLYKRMKLVWRWCNSTNNNS